MLQSQSLGTNSLGLTHQNRSPIDLASLTNQISNMCNTWVSLQSEIRVHAQILNKTDYYDIYTIIKNTISQWTRLPSMRERNYATILSSEILTYWSSF